MSGTAAIPAHAVQSASPFMAQVGWRPVAWRGIPIPSRPQQQGLWGEAILSQTPARVDGIQRENGVSALWPFWTVPGPSKVPIWLRTQAPTNLPGAQRVGSITPHGQGPIAVRKMKRNVTAAQIRQSGLAAQAWITQIRKWS